MSIKDEEFLRQLRATFQIEATEHLQTISHSLLALEKPPGSETFRDIVEIAFRAAHSLKGASRAVDMIAIESLCESLEDVFASWKRHGSAQGPEALDSAHRQLEAIAATLEAAGTQETSGEAPGVHAGQHTDVYGDHSARRSTPQLSLPPAAAAPAQSPKFRVEPEASSPLADADAQETVRISVTKLEAQLRESQELLMAKLTAGQRVADLRELGDRITDWRKAWTLVEPDVRQLRQRTSDASGLAGAGAAPALSRLLDFLDSGRDALKSIEERISVINRRARNDHNAVGKLVDDLLEESKKLLLLPFARISMAYPKIVRDLCRDQFKEVAFSIRGDEIEIDRRVLEEIKDPIIHLLRNAIDHGIEPPQSRERQGKPRRGAITLAVSRVDSSNIQVLLSDDGAGIDAGKVRESAVRHRVLSADAAERLSETEAQALIFESEVSTSAAITQVSGRGLGLAIVREKAEKLGGAVSVESRPGLGTEFRIVIPATVATFRGILIEVAARLLVVPTAQVERVTRARPEDIKCVEGRPTLSVGDRALALVQMADALQTPLAERKAPPAGGQPVLVLVSGDQRIGFAVDAVLGEQEVLLKPLCKPLIRVRNVAAATILGSGEIVPVLNVGDLFKSARKASGMAPPAAVAPKAAPGAGKTILVAEDSMTSRMLLKTILQSAGYEVKVAVDGMDAYTLLRTERFDLVVSDVEMPRMNGFDLTARVRADPKLADLPVVLVTALGTREHRERGIDAGANAYIVKSSFDQSNLLDVVRRLI